MLERQAAITMAGMDALVAWAGGDAEAGAAVRDCEHEADDQKRELWRSLRDAFSPPLDAEDLFTLSAELDEVLNSAKDLVREMEVMNLEPNDADPRRWSGWSRKPCSTSPTPSRTSARVLETQPKPPTPRSRVGGESSTRTAPRCRSCCSTTTSPSCSPGARCTGGCPASGDLVHGVAERVWYSVMKEA